MGFCWSLTFSTAVLKLFLGCAAGVARATAAAEWGLGVAAEWGLGVAAEWDLCLAAAAVEMSLKLNKRDVTRAAHVNYDCG